jgi:hypothetical protein
MSDEGKSARELLAEALKIRIPSAMRALDECLTKPTRQDQTRMSAVLLVVKGAVEYEQPGKGKELTDKEKKQAYVAIDVLAAKEEARKRKEQGEFS